MSKVRVLGPLLSGLLFCATALGQTSTPQPSMPAYGAHGFGGVPGGAMPFPLGAFMPHVGVGSGVHHGMPTPGAVDPSMAWMMSMMGPALSMANPYLYGQWMAAMANPGIDAMTQMQALEAMMNAFDPESMLPKGAEGGYPRIKFPWFPTQTFSATPDNTVSASISSEAKRKAFQTMMMVSPMSMRDMISIMAEKMPVAEDVSFDDAVDSMKLRANEINFKLVGHNALWLDVRAISGDENTPRVEIFQFCDAMVARKVLDHVPEFVVFLPCRIALLEDTDKKLWVMTLDWDVSWMDFAQNPNSNLSAELRDDAKRIREGIRYIMEGAATGDF